ncbi:hypothetical protein [Lapillicoccus jejuensis]|uniref:Uncharacterized protein n=1 Tax=Lapillicoccus jejuensis TaxID=402171 RepID=A0A542DYC2_9MICO|nr:hypothetical protein [Lapillicoccus jejuensis]TQJ08100.1 hypothetical protein FB458_1182 [Lapillicoccus jejuensis]
MKKSLTWSLTAVTCATLALGTALPAQASTSPAGATVSGPSARVVPAGSTLSAQGRATLDSIIAQLPADWQARRDAAVARAHIEHSPAREVLDRSVANAIDPGDYVCNPTPLDGYVDQILSGVDNDSLITLALAGVLDFPTYEAIFYGSPKDPDFALPAAYAGTLTTTFGYAQRFWDVKLEDIQLMAMHGEMTVDVARMTRMVKLFYGLDDAKAVKLARQLVGIVRSDPGLRNGRNPIFTLNAFAFSAQGETDPLFRGIKDKMVFGDGILDALKALGLNAVGPKAVLGHEMAHHVQFEDNLFVSDLTGPEATRRTELMADAFGSYFATHTKGLNLAPNALLQVTKTFYDVGDCQFTSPGHHGTPNQRQAASSWGIAVAASGDPLKVLPSLRLDAKFERVLPQLVASDAPKVPAVPAA